MRHFFVALVLTLLPALASAQMSIDTPTESSTTSFTPYIGGWARDASGSSSGCGIDGVQVWLKPQPAGDWEFLGAATLGDARPDVGEVYGSACGYAGWHLDVSVSMHAGAATLYVFGHNNITGVYTVSNTRDVIVYEADPFFPNPAWVHLDARVLGVGWVNSDHLAVYGYGVRDGHVLSAGQVHTEVLIDDTSADGYGDPDPSAETQAIDCSPYTADGWDCEAPTSDDGTSFGLYGVARLTTYGLTAGWHYARQYVFDWDLYANLVASSNAWWFHVD